MKRTLHLLLAALVVTATACNDDPLYEIPCDAPTADAGPDQTVAEDAVGAGAVVLLDGRGSTPADAAQPITNYTWSEDGTVLNGPSAIEGTVSITFAEGVHVVTLTVTSSTGCTDTDQVTITVEALTAVPPTVTITSPADQSEFDEGQDIDFAGSAEDADGVAIPGADLEWSSSLDGVLGTGETLTVNTLSAGVHLITLTATDADGVEGTESIEIAVNAAIVPSFATDIQPYFVDSGCTACHGAALQLGDIRLDNYTEITTGSNGAGDPLIVAGDAADPAAILIPQLLDNHNDGADDQGFVDTYLTPWINDGALDN
ncbi:MAG: PKD domain-containing protein [Gemmatimonadota bacterium]